MFSDLSIDDQFDELGMNLDVPFVPTHESVVKAMLEMGAVDADDVLYDLGSGDGRIPVAAALEHGARAVGVEIDAGRVALAQAYAAQMGVEDRVCFIQDDLFEVDFAPATVVTMYLLHTVNLELRPRLLTELRPGTRIVSHAFDMGDWKADRKIAFKSDALYLWIVPAQVAGHWHWQRADGTRYRLELEQRYQQLTGELWIDDQPADLEAALLWGDLLELVIHEDETYGAESILMHCQDDQLVVVSEYQKGAVARRLV
ncbi:class I SAM-dependent methyltransferase [Pseudomonas sp. MYb185]|uniref:class I SAM-dependent methyltransferase n=1 Tax=Pseudomonas sp. MYb185 TaxID=1848729 RepID=UPI000CFDFC06|nr:class I SAM-dependent methyltransferase [Pseudomonas sp. MYb185]PRB82915.1 SAM-dependent methyltransferase [Pseudomonas sp. MYb185]